jgi:hypothetical protein
VLAACHEIRSTYVSIGFGPAMAKFIKLVSYEGPRLIRTRRAES